ncbi:MAG: hypothetical protein WEB00_02030 [Dehalococcoidia bacterium]
MYGETGLLVTQDDVARAIDKCDVFLVGFRNTSDRLVVDTRFTDSEPPMVEVSESTGSIEGRMFWLGQRRPQFGLPQQFKFFVWPNSIGWLLESGTWERIRQRLIGHGFDEAVEAQMEVSLQELRDVEQDSTMAAIVGEGYQTIWPPA